MASNMELLQQIGAKKYQDQAIWMLNAMWPKDQGANAEEIYQFVELFASLEPEDGKEGCGLDELGMHRVFEKLQKQLTMQEMRNYLRECGVRSFKKISMICFLIFYYGYNWEEVVNAPQGSNGAELERAKQMLADVQVAFEESTKKATEAKAAASEAKTKATEAKAAADEAANRQKEAAKAADEAAKASAEADKDAAAAAVKQKEAEAADEEAKKAVEDVKAKEKEKADKIAKFEKIIETGSLVQRNSAIQEKNKLLNEDDLPLRRSKTTLEAAQRKTAKANKLAAEAKQKADTTAELAAAAKAAAEEALRISEEAKQKADEAAAEAEEAKNAAEEAEREAEEALVEAEKKVAEAEAYLEDQKKKAQGAGQGAIWFMQREVEEKKKYMPTRKGGIAKK